MTQPKLGDQNARGHVFAVGVCVCGRRVNAWADETVTVERDEFGRPFVRLDACHECDPEECVS